MEHTFQKRDGFFVSWPFDSMRVGDKVVLTGINYKEANKMRNRAMSAARYYMNTRGFVFQSDRTDVQEYTVVRVK